MKVFWTRAATDDLRALEAYIAGDSPFYAREFATRILAATRRLESFPDIGRRVPEAERLDVRELVYQRYRVIYRTTPHKEVHILAVIHGSRDLTAIEPKPWEVG